MKNIDKKPHLHRRRELRANASIAERLLWREIRQANLGFKFRRQHSIDNYIVDFYCIEAKVVVEVDGQQHGSVIAKYYDMQRDEDLKKRGNLVLRFPAWTVCGNLEGVCLEIKKWCEERSGPPFSPPHAWAWGGDRTRKESR